MATGLEAVDLLHRGDLRGTWRTRASSGSWPGCSSLRISLAWRRNSAATFAVFSEAASPAFGSRVCRPVESGSVSATSSPRPSPRNRTTRRYSRTGSIRVSTPSILTPARSLATSFSQVSVGMRPARRSVTRPSASIVQKLPRIATSFGPTSTPMPERLEHAAADVVLERVVAEQAEVPGARAGRDPGRDRRAQADGPLGGQARRGSASGPSPARSCRPARSAGRRGRRPPA